MPQEDLTQPPKSRTSEEILIKSIGQLTQLCEEQQTYIKDLERQTAILRNRLSEHSDEGVQEQISRLEERNTYLQQEVSALRQRIADSEL